MADTALTLITDALLDLGVLADEETPTASQAVGALRKLNNMIDSWNLKSLNVYGATATVIPLLSGQGTYTINQTGMIDSAYVRDNTLPTQQVMDYPLTIYTDEQWQDIPFKNMQAAWPNWGIWINNLGSTQQVYVNPVPSTSNYSLVLWVSTLLNNLSANTEITFAPGYKRALTLALSLELAPSYQVQPSELTLLQAREALDAVRSRNLEISPMRSPLSRGYWDARNMIWRWPT